MDLALKCVTEKYATFSGRAQRKEFWLYVLAYLVLYLIALAVDFSAGTFDRESELGLLTGLLSLGMLIPSLGVTVRRLHDVNRTGWWILISFVPLIGVIVMLVFCCLRGTAGENRFGKDPLSTAV